MTHTPETWTFRRALRPTDGAYDYAIGANVGDSVETYHEAAIAECFGRVSESIFTPAEANARRIVACVNALAGISTEELEKGVVREMVEALENMRFVVSVLTTQMATWDIDPVANAEGISAQASAILVRLGKEP